MILTTPSHFHLPVRVALFDDDFFALKWSADLLTRDLRTTVACEAETPAGLLAALQHNPEVDRLLLDVEYAPHTPPLFDLIRAARGIAPNLGVVCLSQYGESQLLSQALRAGACGFLLKNEVKMEIGSALIESMRVGFVVTPGVLPMLQRLNAPIAGLTAIHAWRPNPRLSPQLMQVFTLRILYGMNTPLTAAEIHLAPATVEKYMQYVYQKLSIRWGNEHYLAGLELADLPLEVQAFHQFNLPPPALA